VLLPACACLLALASSGEPDAAERLKRAAYAEESLEYQQALDELLFVIADKRATQAELMTANLRAGVIQVVLGNDTQARLHFLYVLKRDAAAQLPPGHPPKITAFFELVRQEVSDPVALAPTPAPASTTAPSPAAEPSPPTPAAAQPTEGAFPFVLTGAIVAGIGVVAIVAGGGVLVVADGIVSDSARTLDERRDWQLIGQSQAAPIGLGAVGVLVGAGLVGWGLLAE
jgi:hypothetical protein